MADQPASFEIEIDGVIRHLLPSDQLARICETVASNATSCVVCQKQFRADESRRLSLTFAEGAVREGCFYHGHCDWQPVLAVFDDPGHRGVGVPAGFGCVGSRYESMRYFGNC